MSFTGQVKSVFDTLRLKKADYERIVRQMSQSQGSGAGSDQRQHERHDYFDCKGIELDIQNHDGSKASYVVKPFNISQSGMCFLHGQYLHPGTVCVIDLRTLDGEEMKLQAKVMRCQFVEGRIHTVGVKFDETVDPRLWLGQETEDEEGAVVKIDGTIVYISQNENECQLLSCMAEGVGINLVTLESIDELVEANNELDYQLVMYGLFDNEQDVNGLKEVMEKVGHDRPVVILTEETGNDIHQAILGMGASWVLPKPYSILELQEVVQLFLQSKEVSKDKPLIFSEFWANKAQRPIVLSYLKHVQAQLDKLHELINTGKIMEIPEVCDHFIKNSKQFGFPSLNAKAHLVKEKLSGELDIKGLQKDVNEFVTLCEGVCEVRNKMQEKEAAEKNG